MGPMAYRLLSLWPIRPIRPMACGIWRMAYGLLRLWPIRPIRPIRHFRPMGPMAYGAYDPLGLCPIRPMAYGLLGLWPIRPMSY